MTRRDEPKERLDRQREDVAAQAETSDDRERRHLAERARAELAVLERVAKAGYYWPGE